MKLPLRSCTFLLLLSFIPLTSQAASEQTLRFRAPENSAFTQYVTAVLEEAYLNLGIQLEYVDLPRARGEQLAAEGTIAGELGRTAQLEQKRRDLRRIPFPLFQFDVLAVADRRRCGYCPLTAIESLAYVDGMDSITQKIDTLPGKPSVVTPIHFEQVAKLLESGRIQTAFMTSIQYEGSQLSDNPHFITHTISNEVGYHYLYREYAPLIPKLTYQLQRMQKQGRIKALRQQYGVAMKTPVAPIEPPEQLTVVGVMHPGLLHADGTGTLWEVAKTTFPRFTGQLNTVISSWQRSIQLVQNGRADALMGLRPDQKSDHMILSNYHVAYDDSIFLFSANEPNEGPICISGPQFMQDLVDTERPFYRASDSLDCFALLDLGRVSAVVDYKDNLPDWTETPYKKEQLSVPQPLFVGFADTPKGRALRRLFDNTMADHVTRNTTEKAVSARR